MLQLKLEHHRIYSFVRRAGRFSTRQRKAIEQYWPKYGLTVAEQPLDFNNIFGRQAPLVLEIGFGNGAVLRTLASKNPDINYIGIDVYQPGLGNLLAAIEENQLDNIRVFYADGVEVLQKAIGNDCLDAVLVFFPDPWFKKRHHKRRLIQPNFINLVVSRLKDKGQIHLATDDQPYAQRMLEVLNSHKALKNLAKSPEYRDHHHSRPQTKYEKRGLRLDHSIHDLIFTKEG